MSLNFPNYLSPPKLRKSLQYCLNYTIYASETYAHSYMSVISPGISRLVYFKNNKNLNH